MARRCTIMIVILTAMVLMGCKKKASPPPPDSNEPVVPTEAQGGEAAMKTPAGAMPSKLGDPAWGLDGLEFVKGEPVDIEPGKVTIVEFWATWCGPCLTSIPHLTEVAHKYKDKKVVVVGISSEAADVVKPFVARMAEQMDYNVAVDPSGGVNNGYMRAFNENTIPHAFIVDAAGKIAWHGHPMADLEAVLDQVLAGTFDAAAYAQQKATERAEYEANIRTLQAYFQKINSGATTEEARAIVADWIDKVPASMLNGLAWEILTKVEENQRDKALALKAAEKANALMEGTDASVLDTYGLALFENGKVQEAIAIQEKAVELAKGDPRMAAEFGQRLEQFKAAANK